MTSFRIVSKVRGILNSRLGLKAKDLKVGHAGTLDPLASGVLIVCTGKATKQIDASVSLQFPLTPLNKSTKLLFFVLK